MIRPEKTKFKKYRKDFFKGNNSKAITFLEKIKGGSFVFESLQSGRLTSKQIEAIQQTVNKVIKSKSKLDLRIFPDIPVTKKPAETRMGKGKGSVDFWTSYLTPGSKIFETSKITEQKLAYRWRSIKTKFPLRIVKPKKTQF